MNTRETSRREFLGVGAAGLGIWSLGGLPRETALYGLGGKPARDGEPILVVLQLSGGNDGLNTVIPTEDREYRRARGRLAIAADAALEIEKGVGLHPNMKGMQAMYAAKKLAIVQGVGYPKPNRSHFKSMDIWHAADPTERDLRYGWLGRAMDLMTREASDPDAAVNISAQSPLALNGTRYKPVSFQNPGSYRYAAAADVSETFQKIAKQPKKSANPLLARLRQTADEAVRTSAEIRSKATRYRTPVRYPRFGVAGTLRTVAGLIAGGLSTRVYYTYQTGYDTHTNQSGRHANLLQQLSQSLTAFQRDIERSGVADRVVVMVFSEFGRRVRINGSGGTDHGVAGPMFVLGSRVKGGLFGEQPSLTDLNQGDLEHNVDFRSVYATMLDDWLGVDSKRVLRGEFPRLALV